MRARWKYYWATAMFILSVISAVVSCGGSPAFSAPASSETYKIGGIWPMTGPTAASGQYLRDGAQMAVDDVNAAGGIDGHMLELLVEDHKGFPRDGVMAFKKLLEIDKVAVVLPTLSSVVVALIPEVNENDVVMMNTLAQAQTIVGAGPRIFSIAISTGVEGIAQARFAYNDLGARTAVMMYLKSDLGVSYDTFISAEFEKLGGKMLTREGHDGAVTDFRAVLTKIKQLDPDVVFIESLFTETASMVKQMRELGMDAQVVTYGTVFAAPFAEIAGSAANGVITTNSTFDPAEPREKVQKFVTDYQQRYDYAATSDSALAYDAVFLLAEAMKLGGYSADGITQGLEQLKDIECVCNTYSGFSEEHTVSRPVGFSIFKDGEWLWYKKP